MSMLKIIYIAFAFLFVIESNAQEKNDVRKTKWGMSISDVISAEYPMSPTERKTNELKFTNVELSNGHKATIWYTFRNAQLIEVRYAIYGYDSPYTRGTCSKIIPLYDKVKYTSFIFQSIISKGMKCVFGWHLVHSSSNFFPVGKDNSNLDQQTVEKVEMAASEAIENEIGLDFENDRTRASFSFNQYQNEDPRFKGIKIFECNDDYFNTYYWLVFKPNSNVEAEMIKGDF